MGKKMGVNEKAAGAKQAKEGKKQAQQASSSAAADDAAWAAAGDGKMSKAQQKKEEQAAKAVEAAAKKAEAKKLAAAEEAELASIGKKKPAAPTGKATQHELRLQRDAEAKEREKRAKEHAASSKRSITEDDYGQLVDSENINRRDDAAEARTVEDAISALSVKEQAEADRHPERRLKSAHAAFEEAEIARLKEEKPGLRNSQYKELAFKNWQKSPQNPLNQAALAAAQQDAPPKRR